MRIVRAGEEGTDWPVLGGLSEGETVVVVQVGSVQALLLLETGGL